MLIDFVVTRDRLAKLRRRILIPIVFAAMPDEDRALLFNLFRINSRRFTPLPT
jgi:hypothetical protein